MLLTCQDVQEVSPSPSAAPSSRKSTTPVASKTDECCGGTSSGLAVLIGNLRPDVDEALLKGELIQLLQRRMVQVFHT